MTELVWEGKYRDGKRVAPVRIALPFQTVETVDWWEWSQHVPPPSGAPARTNRMHP